MRHVAGAGVLLAVAVLIVWWSGVLRPGDAGRAPPEPGATQPAPSAAAAGEPDVPVREPVPADRAPVASDARLVVDIVENGKPAPARAVWAFANDPLDLDVRLGPTMSDLQIDGAADGLGRAESPDGTLAIAVPLGAWTKLRVRAQASVGAVRHVRVPPFTGEQRIRVELGGARCALSVQAWDTSLARPLAHAELLLREEPIVRPGALRDFTARTDAFGHAVVDVARQSAVLVRAPGARLDDPAPAAVRVVASAHDVEVACTVVEPPLRRSVTLSLLVDAGLAGRLAKLFLRRLDGVAGDLYPQPGELGAGGTVRIDVPDGDYAALVLPLGTARTDPATLRVRGDHTVALRVLREPISASVRLVGIGDADLPLSVVPQDDHDLAGLDLGLLFVGPYRWLSVEAPIGGVTAGARLCALSRQRAFVSAPLPGLAEGLSVPMVAACVLTVDWRDGPLAQPDGALVHARAGDVELVRALAPRLVDRNRVQRPAWLCAFVVPLGPVDVGCVAADGRELWRRAVDARGPREWLRP